jgi:hypothetical protein
MLLEKLNMESKRFSASTDFREEVLHTPRTKEKETENTMKQLECFKKARHQDALQL